MPASRKRHARCADSSPSRVKIERRPIHDDRRPGERPRQEVEGEAPEVVPERAHVRGAREEAPEHVLAHGLGGEARRRQRRGRRDPQQPGQHREQEPPGRERATQRSRGRRSQSRNTTIVRTGITKPTGPFVSTARPSESVQHELVPAPRADAAVEPPEARERGELERGQQHVELHAPREEQELPAGEEERGAEHAGAAAEEARAEEERESDDAEARERRGQPRGQLGDAPARAPPPRPRASSRAAASGCRARRSGAAPRGRPGRARRSAAPRRSARARGSSGASASSRPRPASSSTAARGEDERPPSRAGLDQAFPLNALVATGENGTLSRLEVPPCRTTR